ncbi:elongator complex protein 3 [Candidatus Omnitrophota bacterium]
MKVIPIFIPHAGCPYRCVYCDQHRISGSVSAPTLKEMHSVIRRNLRTMAEDERKEVAFFGGTFTFLPDRLQEKYLEAAFSYVKKGIIHGIRMSTHPEAVSDKSMKRFKRKGGCSVELGVQSLDRAVLKKIKRETSLKAVRRASRCIRKAGLELGVQIMLGLPGDTIKKSIQTVKTLIELKPETARIYPALVLRGTELEHYLRSGKYRPLSLDEAIEWAAEISDIFENSGVKVIRIGLHPSKALDSAKAVLGGPYHPAFGEMVRSRQMRNKIRDIVKDKYVPNRSHIEIQAPKDMFSFISGHKAAEKEFLEKCFSVRILYKGNEKRLGDPCHRVEKRIKIKDVRRDIALVDPRMPLEAKDRLKRLNYYVAEAPLHDKLQGPVKGHVDMMLFKYKNRIIYEPSLEGIAALLAQNGYKCLKGEGIVSAVYPEDIIYNACNIDGYIIHYKGRMEKGLKQFKCKYIAVTQGYTKCSIVPVDKKRIITSDRKIKDTWERNEGEALLVEPGHVKLPGYKTGFIGGSSGVDDRFVFFVGKLDSHPDGRAMRDFIRSSGKDIIELYNGPLYDVGTVYLFKTKSRTIDF